MARSTTAHTIVRQSSDRMGVTRLESIGSAVMIPGWIGEFKAAGEKLGKVAAKGAANPKLVVLESQTPDTHTYPTTANIDIPYPSGDTVYYMQAKAGDVLNLWLADGETVARGVSYVAAGTAGKVFNVGTGLSVGTSNPIGIAWEDKDNSSGGTGVRLLVRII